MVVAEFDSCELAMENSGRPETDAFARKTPRTSAGTAPAALSMSSPRSGSGGTLGVGSG